MAKNIEMNNLNSDGTYEVVYPKTRQELVINLLNDSTKSFMGLNSTATADDAFKKIYLTNLLNGKSMVEVTFLDSETSRPVQGVVVTCSNFCDASGTSLASHTTDVNGKIVTFVNAINPTISISGYADIDNFSTTLAVDALGKQYVFSFNLTTQNFKKYISSTNVKFSGNIQKLDVTVVGGGGGGAAGVASMSTGDGAAGGGGGGGYCTVQENVSFVQDTSYSIVIGSGGTAGSTNASKGSNGASGGTSSILQISANGGSGGDFGKVGYSGTHGGYGGSGNGQGGRGAYCAGTDGQTSPTAGTNGRTYGYSSFTDVVLYGGGGGGGGAYGRNSKNGANYYAGTSGGRNYGAEGGYWRDWNGADTTKYQMTGYSAAAGTGGGGGGGGAQGDSHDDDEQEGNGGSGGSGCVAIRMHLKSR